MPARCLMIDRLPRRLAWPLAPGGLEPSPTAPEEVAFARRRGLLLSGARSRGRFACPPANDHEEYLVSTWSRTLRRSAPFALDDEIAVPRYEVFRSSAPTARRCQSTPPHVRRTSTSRWAVQGPGSATHCGLPTRSGHRAAGDCSADRRPNRVNDPRPASRGHGGDRDRQREQIDWVEACPEPVEFPEGPRRMVTTPA